MIEIEWQEDAKGTAKRATSNVREREIDGQTRKSSRACEGDARSALRNAYQAATRPTDSRDRTDTLPASCRQCLPVRVVSQRHWYWRTRGGGATSPIKSGRRSEGRLANVRLGTRRVENCSLRRAAPTTGIRLPDDRRRTCEPPRWVEPRVRRRAVSPRTTQACSGSVCDAFLSTPSAPAAHAIASTAMPTSADRALGRIGRGVCRNIAVQDRALHNANDTGTISARQFPHFHTPPEP